MLHSCYTNATLKELGKITYSKIPYILYVFVLFVCRVV